MTPAAAEPGSGPAVYALLVLLVAACALTVPAAAVEALPEETAPAPTARRIAALDRARRGAVGADAVDHHPPHHRHRRHALALGAAARPLSAELRHRLRRRGAAPADFITVLAPLVILDRRRPRLQRRHAAARSSSATLGLLPAVRRSRSRCTREMFRLRPAVGHLTRFYLAMSFGGMLGGLFCAIVAPLAVRLGL